MKIQDFFDEFLELSSDAVYSWRCAACDLRGFGRGPLLEHVEKVHYPGGFESGAVNVTCRRCDERFECGNAWFVEHKQICKSRKGTGTCSIG